ncbi:MAG: NADP-dependent oxidoreductase [Alphaproteobacteria bacterium]|nr:MAG: NADP-dependent oxidoreductase [Alphaproteobacteria bacterium]
MSKIISQYWRLDKRPKNEIEDNCLSLHKEEIAFPEEGEILFRVIYLSLDATNRLWMGDMEELYIAPVPLGEPMYGFVLVEAIESRNDKFKKGDLAIGLATWSEYIISDGSNFTPFPKPNGFPLEAAFGVLAVAGPTAYFGLLDIGQPKAGETVVVTAAAGAVGSLVGQIAKMKGCHVVGLAGSEEKCRWLTDELGFDAAINYKKENMLEALKKHCPDGIDVHFENVGGEVLEAALTLMNLKGRIVVCGLISMYNKDMRQSGPRMFHNTIMKRLRIEGFVVLDYADRFPEAHAVLSQWMQTGRLKYRLDIAEGIESSVNSLRRLYSGANNGKMMVRYSPAPE